MNSPSSLMIDDAALPPGGEKANGDEFERKLSRLRARIDQLPPAQRPHLYELAETIGRQHRQLRERMP